MKDYVDPSGGGGGAIHYDDEEEVEIHTIDKTSKNIAHSGILCYDNT